MNKQKAPTLEPKDDRTNNADIKKQDPKRPYFLNSLKTEPKLQSGIANVEDVTKK
ncbi:MAG: hypothetical protein ACT4PZ_12535 [Panacagrimonas sp.]